MLPIGADRGPRVRPTADIRIEPLPAELSHGLPKVSGIAKLWSPGGWGQHDGLCRREPFTGRDPCAATARPTVPPICTLAWRVKPGAAEGGTPDCAGWLTAATNGRRCDTVCPRCRRSGPLRCTR